MACDLNGGAGETFAAVKNVLANDGIATESVSIRRFVGGSSGNGYVIGRFCVYDCS